MFVLWLVSVHQSTPRLLNYIYARYKKLTTFNPVLAAHDCVMPTCGSRREEERGIIHAGVGMVRTVQDRKYKSKHEASRPPMPIPADVSTYISQHNSAKPFVNSVASPQIITPGSLQQNYRQENSRNFVNL